MQKLINWCKDHWLFLATCFLLAFIPLYPKLPLINVIRTWVYVRLEDFFIGVTIVGFLIYLVRRREIPNTPLTTPIVVYWVVGFISMVWAIIFLRNVIPGFFPHLAILHFGRRIEYMGLFFIGFYAIRKRTKLLPAVVWTLALTLIGIIIYGVGQKFLGWPAYLTMNEEFAKGVPLRLPPTARIASTFGGHYDLAAYLVFIVPLFGSLAFGMKKIWQRLLMILLAAGGLVMLLFTASRISFGVYLVAITTMLIWKRKYWYILPVIVVSFLLLNSVSTASDRFYKTLRFSDVVIDLSTGQPIGTLDQLENGKAIVNKKESPATENLPKGSEFLSVPQVTAPTTPAKTFKTIEVYTSSPLATGSGEIATVSGSFLVQKAFVYDISITTRFQGEWPLAIEAFQRNLLFGSGYSSLSVATDGDYMRMLGETGIAGTVAFLGIFLAAFYLYFRERAALPTLEESFATGVFAGLIGLFLNGILIDVFESSKVAYTLWLLLGITVSILLVRPWRVSYWKLLWQALTHKIAFILYIFIATLLIYKRTFSMYFIGDDFTWLRWAASSTTGDVVKYFTNAAGFFYRPIPKLFYFALYTIFWLKSGAYHIMAVGLFAILSILIFILMKRLRIASWLAFVMALVFSVLSIHHENVIWVSGISSLLYTVFLVTALIGVTYWKALSGWRRHVVWAGILVSTLLSVLSYEGGVITPVIVYLIAWSEGGAGVWEAGSLLVTGLIYVWMRNAAHAITPSGDYSVRLSTVFVNTIGNTIGYAASILFGPRALESTTALRAAMRAQKLISVAFGGAFVVALFVFMKKTMRFWSREGKRLGTWIIAAWLTLVPFIGLGGIAERYGLAASAVGVVALGLLAELLLQKRGLLVRSAVVVVLMGFAAWNYYDLQRVMGDWIYASHITETSVLTLKTNYFPLRDKQAFVFVNTPIRYGRAWVFPTGLNDALWHMFKFNPYPYRVYTAPTVKDGFLVTSPLGTPVVLVFDKNGNISKAIKEVKTIEVK